jgi:DNA-binding GntR family transcriptional regulator
MIDALEARDGGRLATILRGHLLQKCDAVLDTIRSQRGALRFDLPGGAA